MPFQLNFNRSTGTPNNPLVRALRDHTNRFVYMLAFAESRPRPFRIRTESRRTVDPSIKALDKQWRANCIRTFECESAAPVPPSTQERSARKRRDIQCINFNWPPHFIASSSSRSAANARGPMPLAWSSETAQDARLPATQPDAYMRNIIITCRHE